MSPDKIFDAWVNPLTYIEASPVLSKMVKSGPTAENALKYLCRPREAKMDSVTQRYQEISDMSSFLIMAPAEDTILSKLIWPLKDAIGCYMTGNYLGVIALCGMVAEMLAILKYRVSKVGSEEEFEKSGQKERIKKLRENKLIDDESNTRFEIIRKRRRRYLHFISEEHTNISGDAKDILDATMNLVVGILGQKFKEGKIILNSDIVSYLEEKGHMHKVGGLEAPGKDAAPSP